MANKMRGEIDIVLNGKSYTMRPTFDALTTIEGRTNLTISEILGNMSLGRHEILTMSTILWAGIKGYDKDSKLTVEQVGKELFSHGILTFISDNKDEDGESLLTTFLSFGVLGEKEYVRILNEAEEKKKQEELNKIPEDETDNNEEKGKKEKKEKK